MGLCRRLFIDKSNWHLQFELRFYPKRIPQKLFSIAVTLLLLNVLSACGKKPKELWSFETGAPVYSTPSISGNKLIIGSQDHFLYALDMQSGQLIWKQNLGGLIPSKALVINDAIYVGSGSGDFYRLSTDTGQINWKFKTGALIHYNACADDSGIYFGSNDFTFYKLDFESNKIWDFKTTHKFGGHCAFYEDQVITSSWDHNFYGLDKSTGSVRWKVDSGTYNFGGPELIGSDVYFATHKDLYRIDAETGKLIANPKTTYLVHVVSWKDFLWTNERGFTKRRPDLSPVGSVSFTPSTGFRPVSSENCIISASGANKLVAVSEDLKIVWQYEGKDIFFASGIIHNNIYYTGNRDHKVYALQLPAN